MYSKDKNVDLKSEVIYYFLFPFLKHSMCSNGFFPDKRNSEKSLF